MNSKINKKVQVPCSNSRQTEVKSYRSIIYTFAAYCLGNIIGSIANQGNTSSYNSSIIRLRHFTFIPPPS